MISVFGWGPECSDRFAIQVLLATQTVVSDAIRCWGEPVPPGESGFTAQVIGTGPTVRFSAISEVFENLMYAARSELMISNPYFVPDEAMLAALCGSARRGVAITLIGSANMDRRSFELNYENNILLHDRTVTADVRNRLETYLAHSHQVTAEMVAQWSIRRRLWNNTIAMLGPVL